MTAVERRSRFLLPHLIRRKTKEETVTALLRILSLLSEWMLTITYGSGREFNGDIRVAAELDCDDYFARPYRSCDRGTNEKGNLLPRQFFLQGHAPTRSDARTSAARRGPP